MTRDISSFDLVLLLARRWKLLALTGAAALAVATLYAFLAPKWYTANLAVVPSRSSHDTGVLSLAGKLPAGLETYSSEVERIRAVLTSTSVADEVITRFDLQNRYDTEYREHTRKKLWKHCTTSVDRKSGVVTLSCEDRDPKFAATMAAYFGEVGNRVFGRVSASSAREERKFLEQQVAKARQEVDEASRQLQAFQEQHKIVDLPEQSKAVISAMAAIQGELISKQLELSYLKGFSAGTEASVVQLQKQISIMESKLEQLEEAQRVAASAGSQAAPSEFFPGAMNVPKLRFELERLLREQQIKQTVFALTTQRYEMAKLDEARDTSAFQILDHPTTPTYHSRPKRLQVMALGLAAGVTLGALWVLIPAWWRRRARLAVE